MLRVRSCPTKRSDIVVTIVNEGQEAEPEMYLGQGEVRV